MATGRAVDSTRFFARQQPRPAERIPFAQQQRAFERAGVPVRGGMAREVATGRDFGGGSATQPQRAQDNGWRRFGETSGNGGAAGPRRIVNPNDASPQNRGGWQRFGETGGRPDARQATPAARPETQQDRGAWQRFGTPGNQAAPRAPETRPAPQVDRGPSRFGNPGQYGGEPSRQQSAPPVRRDSGRSYGAPRYEAPSTPAYQAPAYRAPAAPRYQAPSPERSWGGGGGSSAPRSYGGGGGYSAPRSSGGGGYSAPRSSGGGGARPSGGNNRGGGPRAGRR